MNAWVLLGFAILSEITATASLKSTEGFTRLWPSVVVMLGYMGAFYFMSMTLDTIPVAVAYAIWSGVGVAGITLISVMFLNQKIDTAGLIGMGLIVLGVVVLRVFSTSHVEA